MKSSRTKWIIIALVLIGVGIMTSFAAMAALDFDFMRLTGESYEISSYTVEESFENIIIKNDISDISIVRSNDGICRIEVKDSSRYELNYYVEEGTLSIEHIDDREWHEHIGIFYFSHDLSLTLYLPEDTYGKLTVDTDTGNLTSSYGLCFDSVKVEGTTADVSFFSEVKGAFECSLKTGSTLLENISVTSLELEATTGEINIRSVDVENICRITVSTGDCGLSDVFAGELYMESSTGTKTLDNVKVKGLMKLTSDTGDVMITDSDAETINIETSTGEVNGVLLTPKIFYTESSTGDIKVPKTHKGGICEIRTSTGDIEISVKNP